MEVLSEKALEMGDIWLGIMLSSHGDSLSKMERQREEIGEARRKITREVIGKIKEKERLYNLVINLKKDGLVYRKEKSGRKFWQLTSEGEAELKRLKKFYGENALPEHKYESQVSEEVTIIAFDVPEKERRKREWLRRKLIEMKFKKLQGSVWVGKRRLPERFIEDLSLCKLTPCVEIFTVGKTGTLKKLS